MDPRDPTDGAQPPAAEVARLDAQARLARGAAHALNNAFTAALGELSFLRDDRKEDPLVTEACQAIAAELERCARITRGLLARRRPGAADEVDLVGLLRELATLLEETLGSRHGLRVHTPDDLMVVRGDPAAVEVAVLALVHYAADCSEGTSRISLSLERGQAGTALLRLEASAEGLADWTVAAFDDPTRAPDPLTRAGLEAVAGTVEALGGRRSAAAIAPDAWAALLQLPNCD